MILGFGRKKGRAFPSGNGLAVVLELGRSQILPHAPKLLLRRVLWSKRSCGLALCLLVQKEPYMPYRLTPLPGSESLWERTESLPAPLISPSGVFQEYGLLMISTSKYDLRDLIKLITSATYQKWMKVRIAPHILFFEEVLILCSLLFSLSWKDLYPKRPFIPTDSKTF